MLSRQIKACKPGTCVSGLGEEQEQELAEWIAEAGGEVVFSDYTGIVDYLITPVTG